MCWRLVYYLRNNRGKLIALLFWLGLEGRFLGVRFVLFICFTGLVQTTTWFVIFILARHQVTNATQSFKFTGDDDVWVFLDKYQVICSRTRGCGSECGSGPSVLAKSQVSGGIQVICQGDYAQSNEGPLRLNTREYKLPKLHAYQCDPRVPLKVLGHNTWNTQYNLLQV